ncbi:MAG: MFS transporter [Actinophytocola sp.]|nr:MFS transporter [Actinophytocola sp.]
MTLAVAAAGIASFALLYAPQPVLPQIADAYRIDPGTASLAVSVATGGLAIAVLPIATLSEIVGRRRVIITSLVCSVLLGLLIPFAPNYPVLLVLRGLQGAAIAGFPGVAAAFLVEKLGARGVAGAVGAMVAGNTIGGMLGRLATGFTTDALGWQAALGSSAVLSLACASVALLALRAQRRRSEPCQRVRSSGRGALIGIALRQPLLLAQYGVALLGMGSFVALYNAAAFRLTSEPLNLTPAVASLVFLSYAMGAVSSSFAGRIVGAFGRVRSLIGALVVMAAGSALTLSTTLWLVVTGFVVLSGGFFAAHAVSSGWTAFAANPAGRAQASGLYTLGYYVGSSVGGTVGTMVYAAAGWGAVVGVVAAWLAIAGVGVLVVRGKEPSAASGAKPAAPRRADHPRPAASRA